MCNTYVLEHHLHNSPTIGKVLILQVDRLDKLIVDLAKVFYHSYVVLNCSDKRINITFEILTQALFDVFVVPCIHIRVKIDSALLDKVVPLKIL